MSAENSDSNVLADTDLAFHQICFLGWCMLQEDLMHIMMSKVIKTLALHGTLGFLHVHFT